MGAGAAARLAIMLSNVLGWPSVLGDVSPTAGVANGPPLTSLGVGGSVLLGTEPWVTVGTGRVAGTEVRAEAGAGAGADVTVDCGAVDKVEALARDGSWAAGAGVTERAGCEAGGKAAALPCGGSCAASGTGLLEVIGNSRFGRVANLLCSSSDSRTVVEPALPGCRPRSIGVDESRRFIEISMAGKCVVRSSGPGELLCDIGALTLRSSALTVTSCMTTSWRTSDLARRDVESSVRVGNGVVWALSVCGRGADFISASSMSRECPLPCGN